MENNDLNHLETQQLIDKIHLDIQKLASVAHKKKVNVTSTLVNFISILILFIWVLFFTFRHVDLYVDNVPKELLIKEELYEETGEYLLDELSKSFVFKYESKDSSEIKIRFTLKIKQK